MDLTQVQTIKHDGDTVVVLWFGSAFVWPDPWHDLWEEVAGQFWGTVWHDAWTITVAAEE